jgi:hypothetical protein
MNFNNVAQRLNAFSWPIDQPPPDSDQAPLDGPWRTPSSSP